MQANQPFGDTGLKRLARLQHKSTVELREERLNRNDETRLCPVCGGPLAGIVTRGPSTHRIEPCGCSVGPLTVREVLDTTETDGARAVRDSVDDYLLCALDCAEEPRVRELVREALQHRTRADERGDLTE